MSALRRLPVFVLLLCTVTVAQDFPDAPHSVIDKKFITLAALSTTTSFADSYTTTWARQNWLAGKTGVCNIERESAYLYGTHPTPGRVYAVAAGKSLGSLAASYYLRKHHSRLWSLPLAINSAFGVQGMTQNLIMCN